MTQATALEDLISALDQLVKILAHDPACQWRRHFERCLAYAQALKAEGFDAAKCDDLSSQICSVYSGMGSFADYAPVSSASGNSFSVIAGMENFDSVAARVHARALALDSANMNKNPWDSLELKIPPLLLTLIFAACMAYGAHLLPSLGFALPWRSLLSVACGVVGIGIILTAVLTFRKAQTTVNPISPESASCLVTTGIFTLSRNPMYLGMLLILLAWAIWLAHILAFLYLPLFVLYMNRFQILPEERFLSAYFVLVYPDYEAKVRRWL